LTLKWKGTAIASEQRQWRALLNSWRFPHGAGYFREWWHFSYNGSAESPAYDFAITPRGR
jgi:D-alanyl-D-alanine dipeptidase